MSVCVFFQSCLEGIKKEIKKVIIRRRRSHALEGLESYECDICIEFNDLQTVQ